MRGICTTRILSSLAATHRDKQFWQHGREVYRASRSARKKKEDHSLF